MTGKKIVSILSGKGGVGKSVITYNLADTLVRLGKSVLVVDADLHFGNQHVLANINVDYGVKQLIRGELSLNEAAYKIRNNLYLLSSSISIGMLDDIDLPTIAGFMNTLREESQKYDIILIDQSSGLSKTTSVLAYASDLVITVLVPELTSISDGYGLFKYLHDVDDSLDCRLLVNRVESSDEAEYIYSKLCAIAERFVNSIPKYFGFISEDEIFRKAVASQTTINSVDSLSTINEQFNTLAHKLLGEQYRPLTMNQNSQSEIINKPAALADIKE